MTTRMTNHMFGRKPKSPILNRLTCHNCIQRGNSSYSHPGTWLSNSHIFWFLMAKNAAYLATWARGDLFHQLCGTKDTKNRSDSTCLKQVVCSQNLSDCFRITRITRIPGSDSNCWEEVSSSTSLENLGGVKVPLA